MLAFAPNPSQLHANDHSEHHLDASPQSDEDENDHKKVGKWTPEEDELLRKYAPMYDEKQWRKISNHIPGRSSIQCLHRWTKILKPGLVKGPWTAEEDQRLLTWVRTEGPTKWAQAANFIKGRSGKQCRERWFNNLNPNVKKGNWSKMEDELIFELYQKYGTSWSKIAKYLPGRTENAIKNRFYSTLRKLAADKRKVKTDIQGDSESIKSDEESPEEPKNCVAMSTSQASAAMMGMSSRLYRLLQDTTYVEEQNEHKESSTRDGKECQDGVETSNNESAQKATQDTAEKAKKVAVKKETKTGEQTSYGGPVKSARHENEDNDLAFEKFLLSMDETTDEDFLSREFESNCDSEDLLHFDDLQQKILNYCQDNIHGLAEAFKDIANNDIDVATHHEKRHDLSKMRSMPQILPRNAATNAVVKPKVEATTTSPGNLFQQNIKGIKISAPIPVTHISSNKKPNPIEMVPCTGSNIRSPMNYYTKNEDEHGQGYLMMPNHASGSIQMDGYEMFGSNSGDMYGSKNLVKREGVTNSHINNINKLVHKAQEVGSKNNPEGEKRLTFLFQQLHSLEDLLTNTRNELMKLESTYSHNPHKNNMEKDIKEIANEESFIERALKTADEGYEPHEKKRKRF